ncbi:MAG: hypothetical protein JST58_03540 [Bacteroidetes bacterium]|nr:hypothetical protein [Bacteroidota bacterium]
MNNHYFIVIILLPTFDPPSASLRLSRLLAGSHSCTVVNPSAIGHRPSPSALRHLPSSF